MPVSHAFIRPYLRCFCCSASISVLARFQSLLPMPAKPAATRASTNIAPFAQTVLAHSIPWAVSETFTMMSTKKQTIEATHRIRPLRRARSKSAMRWSILACLLEPRPIQSAYASATSAGLTSYSKPSILSEGGICFVRPSMDSCAFSICTW